MPPKPKDPKKGLYKQGTPLKDVIPATIKQPPREGKPVRPAEFTPTTPIINQYQPQQEFEEWPGDEAALNFDFGLESQAGKVFTDPVSFPVPPSFKARESDIIFWRRPKELVRRDVTEASPSLTSLGAKSKLRKQRTGVDGVIEGRMSICEEDTGLGLYEKEEMEIVMFETYEREETAEEAELRVKEIMERQQQQKKKPAGKKEEPIDTNPIRIKDVRLNNISMKEEVPAYSKWIASQLQVIKDLNMRDVNSQKPIWSRIYPQKEGVPVVNPSGRYWVKMYYMGKERKIEVDDRVPVVFGESLFARSVKDNEIWTYVLAKAIIKLNSGRWVDPKVKDVEVGDGSIIYALTGYLPETVNISANLQDKWRSISHALSDKNYNSGEKYITCFCMPDFRPSAPSNRAKIAREVSLDSKRGSNKRDSVRSQTVVRSVPRQSADNLDPKGLGIGKDGQVKRKDPPSATILRSPRQDNPLSKREDGRERPSHVMTGFAYAVVDTFENENFNMVYALKRTEQEVKLRTDLANLQKVSMNKMSKEEKIEHRKLVKDMKEKWAVEDARRREMVKVPAEHYKLLKIKSSAGKVSALSFNTFDQEDVTLARKCILNKLTKPPNYDMYDIKQDEKSASSAQVETQKILPLDDFSKVENFKEPVRRPAGGTWLTDQDLEGCFQYLQVFHDPTRFKYKETHAIAARQDEELVGFEDKEVIIIEAVPEEEEKDKEKEKDHAIAHHSFLYSFAATRPSNMGIELKPSFVLQKYDFQRFEVAQAYKPLNQPHDSDCLTLDNKNQVFRVQLTSPMSCYLWICSNLHYRLTSVADFLCTYEGYQTKTQQIDYPVIEKNRYHLFYKGIINALSQKERIICRIKSSTDNVILRSIRIKLVEITQKDYVSSEDFKTGVVTFPLEKAYYASKTASITLEPEKRYMIVIEGRMPETANEGVLDFDIMFQNPEFGIETVEQVEPLEYVDKYVPTKYGVLFSERLFLNNEVQASFFVRISDILGNSAQQATQKGKKPEVSQVEEREITEQRTIKLELIRDNQLVAYAFGQNKAVLSNVGLYPTNNKDEARSYLLQARFDLREWPEAKEESEQTCNLHWTLKVSSSDTIVVIKDTIKEDNIKAIKKSWEEKEPGRAEKAKTARRKYLILEKIKKGEPVDQEELQLINEPRQRKNKEEEQKKDPKGKAAPPKGKAPPPAKGGKKEEAPVEEKKEERPVPKSYDHVMGEICTFLTHMENFRLLEEGDDGEGPKVRTEEERIELREKVLLGKEEVYGMVDRNKQVKQKIKDILTEKKEKTLVDMQAKRQETKEKLSAMIREREEFRKKDKEIKDKERAVIALCKNEKPNLEDVVKSLSENTGVVDPGLLKILERVRKNAYIGDKVERISSALVVYDIPVLTAVLEEIKNEEIDIDAELYDKAEEMIDMAEKNPTFIAEKQKEAQKAVKGKKK